MCVCVCVCVCVRVCVSSFTRRNASCSLCDTHSSRNEVQVNGRWGMDFQQVLQGRNCQHSAAPEPLDPVGPWGGVSVPRGPAGKHCAQQVPHHSRNTLPSSLRYEYNQLKMVCVVHTEGVTQRCSTQQCALGSRHPASNCRML